jgi:hypothetical protein
MQRLVELESSKAFVRPGDLRWPAFKPRQPQPNEEVLSKCASYLNAAAVGRDVDDHDGHLVAPALEEGL